MRRTGGELRLPFELVAATLLVLGGCTGFGDMPWQRPQAEPERVAAWLEDPRGYGRTVTLADRERRGELRLQALEGFLRVPSPEQQLRVLLVYDASVVDLEDAFQAQESLMRALDERTLTANMQAVLMEALMRTERRVGDMRKLATTGSEMAVLKEQYRNLEGRLRELEQGRAIARRDLAEAEAKLRALKSIEQALESDVASGQAAGRGSERQ